MLVTCSPLFIVPLLPNYVKKLNLRWKIQHQCFGMLSLFLQSVYNLNNYNIFYTSRIRSKINWKASDLRFLRVLAVNNVWQCAMFALHIFVEADAVQSISGWQNENWACNDFIHGENTSSKMLDKNDDFVTKESCKSFSNFWKFQMGTHERQNSRSFFFLVESN